MGNAEPCDLHELTGCSICSGLDKKLAAEERSEFGSGIMTWSQAAVLGDAPPGFVRAKYDGKCTCGEWFPAGTALRRGVEGWIAPCCQ